MLIVLVDVVSLVVLLVVVVVSIIPIVLLVVSLIIVVAEFELDKTKIISNRNYKMKNEILTGKINC
jgi:hypothetical protein